MRRKQREMAMVLAGIAPLLLGTSCIRVIYVRSEMPLLSCPADKATFFPADLSDAEWKIFAKPSQQDCKGHIKYQLEAIPGTKGLLPEVKEGRVYLALSRDQGRCTLQIAVEGLCERDQSVEDCKKALSMQNRPRGPGLVRQAEALREVLLQRLKSKGISPRANALSPALTFLERADFEKTCEKYRLL